MIVIHKTNNLSRYICSLEVMVVKESPHALLDALGVII